jgi:5-formyltetrahydrofolate cyclo-ligase
MKQNLKTEMFEKRKALSKEEIKDKSSMIKEKLYSLSEFKDAKNVLFYVSFNKEVDTHTIIKETLNEKNNKKIIVPYVLKNNPILQLSEINNFEDLKPKTFGILEPKEDKIKKFDIENVDLVIVPGIAFDKNGHRIGYGYGYYDRFLKRLDAKVKKVGLAFYFQLIDKIPEEKHDIPMDIIITEEKVYK